MNPYDQGLIAGLVIGAAIAGLVASALWHWRDRVQGPLVPVPPDDKPFRPVSDADLRLLRICDKCRRYLGPHRTLTAGQHLNVLASICPRCAKRAAVAAAPKPAQA